MNNTPTGQVFNSTEATNQVLSAISQVLSTDVDSMYKICEVRNAFITHEIAFVIDNEITVFTLDEIQDWAERIELTFFQYGDPSIGHSYHFEINGSKSTHRYESEHKALIAAFFEFRTNEADLAAYELFQCQQCEGYFDIEDSIQIKKGHLICDSCDKGRLHHDD